jgi:hypothetical protein
LIVAPRLLFWLGQAGVLFVMLLLIVVVFGWANRKEIFVAHESSRSIEHSEARPIWPLGSIRIFYKTIDSYILGVNALDRDVVLFRQQALVINSEDLSPLFTTDYLQGNGQVFAVTQVSEIRRTFHSGPIGVVRHYLKFPLNLIDHGWPFTHIPHYTTHYQRRENLIVGQQSVSAAKVFQFKMFRDQEGAIRDVSESSKLCLQPTNAYQSRREQYQEEVEACLESDKSVLLRFIFALLSVFNVFLFEAWGWRLNYDRGCVGLDRCVNAIGFLLFLIGLLSAALGWPWTWGAGSTWRCSAFSA